NTPGAGAAPGVVVQIGYSATNNNPSLWTNWFNANYAGDVGNNDEYLGSINGLPAGTYYYAFRYQINGCGWQYGGYSSTGGGLWNGTSNVSGVLNVIPLPVAGNDASVTFCSTGTAVNLYNSLGALAQNTGTWTGPSSLSGGYLGTFNPLSNASGAYTYTVSNGVCPPDEAVVTVTLTNSPTASISYPSPLCNNITTVISPTIVGSVGGTFIASSGGLGLQSNGTFIPANASVGAYTVTYSIPAANGCAAVVANASVVIVAAPFVPSLQGTPLCSDTTTTFTAGNGSIYEFFVNGISTGPPSATNTLVTNDLSAGTIVCVRSYLPVPIMDGNLLDAEWPPYINGTTGGPSSMAPFLDSRLDGFKVMNRRGILYGAIAGSEIDGATQPENNRVLLFIDALPGGFSNLGLWTNRSGLPTNTNGIINLNGGVSFDPGFEPDFILAINRANLAGVTYYDLYNMVTNTNNYLGSSPSGTLGFQENAFDGDLTKGFEFAIPLSAIGSPATTIKFFGMMVNDPPSSQAAFMSNQFITVANVNEGNYGDGSVVFGSAAPNPVVFPIAPECYQETCLTINPTVVPLFNPIGPFCVNDVYTLPGTSINGISGTWSPSINYSQTTTYTFTPNTPGCYSQTTLSVIVNPIPTTSGVLHD
ncbi:MAG: hypothetical protein ACKO6L_05075, partial [Flavobacteriales bacterium]